MESIKEEIKSDIEEQDQGKKDVTTNTDEIACSTPQMNETSTKLEAAKGLIAHLSAIAVSSVQILQLKPPKVRLRIHTKSAIKGRDASSLL